MNIYIAGWKTTALLHFDLEFETRHCDTSMRNVNFWNQGDQQCLVYWGEKLQI